MSSTNHGVSLHVTVHIDPKDSAKFFAAFKPLHDLVVSEPECTFFEVYQSHEDLGTISWVENWSKSREWINEVQLKKEYYAEHFKILFPLFTKEQELKMLDRLGPPYYTVKQ